MAVNGDFLLGDWLVQPSLNRLTHGQHTARVEPKVMQVLVCLAQASGEVVSRETIVASVWSDVFVTDDVLHRAIRELRRLFGDATGAPRYIETIRKRGYRLLVPVTPSPAIPSPSARVVAVGRPPLSFVIVAAAFATCLVAIVSLGLRTPDVSPHASARFVPVVSSPLNEFDPALSPDGRRLAYAERAATAAPSAAIFVRDLDTGQTTRISAADVHDRFPVWSPDGARLAFARLLPGCTVIVRDLADGRDQPVAECPNHAEPRMAWTADGRSLVTSASGSALAHGWRLVRLDVATGAMRPLTTPSGTIRGDHSPSLSPDGTRIAFIRGLSGGVSDLYVVPIAGGEPQRVTHDAADLTGVDWTADGRALIYASDRAGGYSLWRVPVSGGGEPVLIAGGAARMKHPVSDRTGRRIVYENWNYEINLWRVPLDGDAAPAAPLVAASDLWHLQPQLSPDGSRLAFVSTASGSHQLWIAASDGSGRRQLTHHARGLVSTPRWSPDGRRLVYLARGRGASDVHVVDVERGQSLALTATGESEVMPVWDTDGAHVIFGVADVSGGWRVMRAPANAAHPATEMLLADARAAQPSPDGASLFFTRPDRPGLWRVGRGSPVAAAVPILASVPTGDGSTWHVTSRGIYSVMEVDDEVELHLTPLHGGDTTTLTTLPRFSWPGYALSPDGRSAIYARWDRRDSNLMSIEY